MSAGEGDVVSADGGFRATAYAAVDREGRTVWTVMVGRRAPGDPQWVGAGTLGGVPLPAGPGPEAAGIVARLLVGAREEGYRAGRPRP